MIGKKPRILIADDDENILQLLELCLPDFNVKTAQNGEEAMNLWKKGKNFDLVILDLMMPKMNGWEVCRKIKEGSSVPVLILTAKETTAKDFDIKPDGFIIKPFDPEELVRKINIIIGGG